jgi:hypothetical protein
MRHVEVCNGKAYRVQWRIQAFCSERGSTNSVEDTGHGERRSGGSSPLVMDSVQFINE